MAIIRAKGLYQGERLAACSDVAQLHWPRLYLYANGFSRFEINVPQIIATVYASMRVKPTQDEVCEWLGDYHDHFLLFIYDDPATGAPWAQWLTAKENLATYRTAEDNRSPGPDERDIEAYRQAYRDSKRAKFQKLRDVSKPFQTLLNHPELSETFVKSPEPSQTTSVGFVKGGFRAGEGDGGGAGGGSGNPYRVSREKPTDTHPIEINSTISSKRTKGETVRRDGIAKENDADNF